MLKPAARWLRAEDLVGLLGANVVLIVLMWIRHGGLDRLGSVAAGSRNPVGAWRVGVRHPHVVDRVAAVLAVNDLAVATSATYERGAHIRDPRSSESPAGLQSVTVVGPSLTWADAYATTAFVLGLDGLAWAADHAGYGALAITADDRVIWTPVVDEVVVCSGRAR